MYRIRKAAVLGSGVMGSAIACHFANIGLEVLMLDILPSGETNNRNKVADDALAAAKKDKPAPLYKTEFAGRISTGNFEDDFEKIGDADWIIEVVVERLDIKKKILDQVDRHRRHGSIVSSNTSGIPIHLMTEGRSEDFQKHFLGTHFFNPPRYLQLLEIIPTEATDPGLVDFMMRYGDVYLGKQTVLCKDTPAFIGNRVGVYAMARIFELTGELGLSIEAVDKLTGPAIGRPKTGTFRLSDLVGLDVAMKVIHGIVDNCPDDEQIQNLTTPDFLDFLMEQEFYGNKSGRGFYHRTREKDEKGRTIIESLDLEKKEYRAQEKPKLDSLGLSKQIDELDKRLRALFDAEDAGGQLIRKSLAGLFAYVSHRVPEISDNIYSIDRALRAGFAWEMGPFEYWNAIGLKKGIEAAKEEGLPVAEWVEKMAEKGHESFYREEDGIRQCYDPQSASYKEVPGAKEFIVLDSPSPVFSNDEVVLHDIGDSVLDLEFRSKGNSIGEGVLRGLLESIQIAEEGDWRGLVIGNREKNFSVGANLMLLGMLAFQKEYDQLDGAIRLFQETSMRCRYSGIPVVAATQGYVFGGACEILMHCDASSVAAESYIGLVEVGVGILPAGAGTKEFALRTADSFSEGDVQIPTLVENFRTIATASVSTSAHEAFDHGYLVPTKDEVVINARRNIQEAKEKVLQLAEDYVQPIQRDVFVLGRQGLAALYIAAHSLKLANYASEHDVKIANKIAYVLCGGDLTSPQEVPQQYLLDLEREAMLSLVTEQKTLERIQYMIENRKPLRN